MKCQEAASLLKKNIEQIMVAALFAADHDLFDILLE